MAPTVLTDVQPGPAPVSCSALALYHIMFIIMSYYIIDDIIWYYSILSTSVIRLEAPHSIPDFRPLMLAKIRPMTRTS